MIMAVSLWLPWLFISLGVDLSLQVKDFDRDDIHRQDLLPDNVLSGPLLRKPLIQELSWKETHLLMKQIPDVDHILVFYIPLNSICRQFMNLFVALSQHFETEKKEVKFAKVNCNSFDYGENLCQRLNISHVPTVVYVSSLPLQRESLATDNIIKKGLHWCISRCNDDIKAVHATCYKGDLFLYDELKDWADIMYRLSQIRRGLTMLEPTRLLEYIKKLLTP